MCFDDIRERELRSVAFVMLEGQSMGSSPTTEMRNSGSKGEVEMLLMHRMAVRVPF